MHSLLRRFLSALVIALSLVLCACSGSTPLDIEKYHGKWVFINYWATWCESCKLEIPELNAFAKSHPNTVIFFGVNYDGLKSNALRQAIAAAHFTFPVLKTDPAATLKLGAVNVVPTTFVFDPNGYFVTTLVGPQSQMSLDKIIR